MLNILPGKPPALPPSLPSSLPDTLRGGVGTLRKHRAAVNAVHGADVREPTRVSASADRTVRVWDAARQRKLATLRGHEGGVACAQFAPDAAQVVSVGADGTLRWWDWRASRETTGCHKAISAIRPSL